MFCVFVDCEPAAFFISVLFRLDGRVKAFHGGSALVTTVVAAAAGDSLRTTSYGLNIKSNSREKCQQMTFRIETISWF